MGWLQILRLAALSFAVLSGIIVASLSAHITAFIEENFATYYVYAALGIATGGLTFFTVPVLLLVDFLRTGAFTSYIIVELSWLSVLWVLWLATGALTVNDTAAVGVFQSCDYIFVWVNQICHETQAIEAFSFLAWIVLMGYTVTLLVIALISARRGKPIWTSSVKQYAPAPAATAQPVISQPEYKADAFAPQTAQQQLLYQQPHQNGVSFQQQHPPQPAASPVSVPSTVSYPTQPSYPQV
ncbi:hypothetical protein BD311DRAFT_752995 [Dichomitus squalens]|uniref:MARVEL domain-containing protein n=1 Tax=Dichomitus squalens TaxID=114155 RepID=A0A4Q9MX41_9APHY|nr:hypothetical protein BD311DRAFT_752995 [Dichomitus squalens]TBU57230.1 hypothetical protein BD310DRAFT_822074 [Dichomitus squalens]